MGALEYRIHPAVGVARVGDSETHFFVGPERPERRVTPRLRHLSTLGDDEDAGDTFRDRDGHLAKQAARFRVFAYHWADHDEPTGWPTDVWEVGPDEAALVWTVEVANRKAGTATANEPAPVTLDPADLDDVGQPVLLEAEDRLPLGRVAVEPDGDHAGALLVIGSDGRVEDTGERDHQPGWLERDVELDPGAAALLGLDRVYNRGWVDDVADGRVTVEVRPTSGAHHDGLEPTYRSAWVVVAPPDYAPDAPHLVSLHDVLVDRGERWFALGSWLRTVDLGLHPPDLELDVLRLLQACIDLRWSTPPIEDADAESALALLSDHDDPAELAKSDAPTRSAVLSLLRPPLRLPLPPERIASEVADEVRERAESSRWWPAETGEAGHVLPWARYLAMPRTTFRWLAAWREDPSALPLRFAPEAETTAAQLDAANLGSLSGGPFRPGIEVGAAALGTGRWVFDHGAAPAHLDLRFTGDPGDLTFDLAVPWQVTFQGDEERWWPTSRPVAVTPVDADEAVRWDRDPDAGGERLDFLTRWHELGVLRRQVDGSLRESDRASPGGTPSGSWDDMGPVWGDEGLVADEDVANRIAWYRGSNAAEAIGGLTDVQRRYLLDLLRLDENDLVPDGPWEDHPSITVTERLVQRVAGFQYVQLVPTEPDGRLGATTLGRLGFGEDPVDEIAWNAGGYGPSDPDLHGWELTGEARDGTFVGEVLATIAGGAGVARPSDLRERDGDTVVGYGGELPRLTQTPASLIAALAADDLDLLEEAFERDGLTEQDVVANLALDQGEVPLTTLALAPGFRGFCELFSFPTVATTQRRWLADRVESIAEVAGDWSTVGDDDLVMPRFGTVVLALLGSALEDHPGPEGTGDSAVLEAHLEVVGALASELVGAQEPWAPTAAVYARRLLLRHVLSAELDDWTDLVDDGAGDVTEAAHVRTAWEEVRADADDPEAAPAQLPASLVPLAPLVRAFAPVWLDAYDPERDLSDEIASPIDQIVAGLPNAKAEFVPIPTDPSENGGIDKLGNLEAARHFRPRAGYDASSDKPEIETFGVELDPLPETYDELLDQMRGLNWLGSRDRLGTSGNAKGRLVTGHPLFLQRLWRAQEYLDAVPHDSSYAELFPGFGANSDWRTDSRYEDSKSYHVLGMALDIAGGRNPWIGSPFQMTRRHEDHWIIFRAVWLMRSTPGLRDATSISPVRSAAWAREYPPGSSGELWDRYDRANRAVKAYLALAAGLAAADAQDEEDPDAENEGEDDDAERYEDELRSLLEDLGARPEIPEGADRTNRMDDLLDTPSGEDRQWTEVGEFLPDDHPPGDLEGGGFDAWRAALVADHATIDGRGGGGITLEYGFMDLPRILVVAMRDHAQLSWAACDFGQVDNGDFMHFDLREPGLPGHAGRPLENFRTGI